MSAMTIRTRLLIASLCLAIQVAGCTIGGAEMVGGPGNYSADAFVPHERRWLDVAAASFFLDGNEYFVLDVNVPKRAGFASINVTLESGVTSDLRGSLGSCGWDAPGSLVANGQQTGWGCEAVETGPVRLMFAQSTGRLRGSAIVGVIESVCRPAYEVC